MSVEINHQRQYIIDRIKPMVDQICGEHDPDKIEQLVYDIKIRITNVYEEIHRLSWLKFKAQLKD